MAGVRVTVCLPPAEGVDLRTRLAAALAPFEEGVGYSWERERWDWWTVLGGSDGTGFWIADDADEASLIHDDPHFTGAAMPSRPGMCAGGPRRLLDLSRPRRDGARHAGEAWDTWHRLARSLPPALTLTQIEQWPEHAQDQHMVWVPVAGVELPDTAGRVRAREVYLSQPLVRAVEHLPAWHAERRPYDFVDEMTMSRDAYIELAVARTDRKSDILTPDGWWAAWSERPAHGACDSFQTCPHSPPFSEQPTLTELALRFPR